MTASCFLDLLHLRPVFTAGLPAQTSSAAARPLMLACQVNRLRPAAGDLEVFAIQHGPLLCAGSREPRGREPARRGMSPSVDPAGGRHTPSGIGTGQVSIPRLDHLLLCDPASTRFELQVSSMHSRLRCANNVVGMLPQDSWQGLQALASIHICRAAALLSSAGWQQPEFCSSEELS